jgi:hypothetical protein
MAGGLITRNFASIRNLSSSPPFHWDIHEEISMKAALVALALCTALGACHYIRYPSGPDAGNPNHRPYAGEKGSTYDMAANPPFSGPPATYNPQAPLPPVATPQPTPPAATARPLPPIR